MKLKGKISDEREGMRENEREKEKKRETEVTLRANG